MTRPVADVLAEKLTEITEAFRFIYGSGEITDAVEELVTQAIPACVAALADATTDTATPAPTAADVVRALEALLDDADQFTDTLRKPNRISVWGVRRELMKFGGKPHRWPVPAEFCAECGHHTYGHDDEECLQPDCDCVLSEREAAFGRDEATDDAISSAIWEEAVANGEPWTEAHDV